MIVKKVTELGTKSYSASTKIIGFNAQGVGVFNRPLPVVSFTAGSSAFIISCAGSNVSALVRLTVVLVHDRAKVSTYLLRQFYGNSNALRQSDVFPILQSTDINITYSNGRFQVETYSNITALYVFEVLSPFDVSITREPIS